MASRLMIEPTFHDSRDVQPIKGVLYRQNLDRTQCGEQVRVVVWVCTKAA